MMLQTLSHSPSASYAPSHDPHDPPDITSSMSAGLVAILPPRAPPTQQDEREGSTLLLPQRPRPKLSINTTQVRTFGKGSSLRLDTLSAVSPTIRNTFSNAYAAPALQPVPAPTSISTPTRTPTPTPPAPTTARPPKPRLGLAIDPFFSQPPHSRPPGETTTPSSALSSALSSAVTSASSSSSSTASATITVPYRQPYNLTSILANSPARALQPRKMAPARPMFTAEKKVSFRTPLEEEITTTKYTLAHSDLQSSLSSLSTVASSDASVSESEASTVSLSVHTGLSESSSSSSDAASPSAPSDSDKSSASALPPPLSRGPQLGDKRDSSESDSDSAPETPVAGRRKRRREWHWTLGPLDTDKSSSAGTGSSSTSEVATSEDSN